MAKILVVDDEKEAVNLYYNILSKEGFKVLTATNGRDCLSLAEKELPDLILLDVMMPEMDGGDIAQNLSENEKTKNTPIIFLTSLITKEEEGRIGERLFISKFSSIEDIIKKIKGVLKKE
jgi:CheY-like chemotaxis protein